MILKLILRKWDVSPWTGFICLNIRLYSPMWMLCEHGNEHKIMSKVEHFLFF
jgi:hypothetical protein